MEHGAQTEAAVLIAGIETLLVRLSAILAPAPAPQRYDALYYIQGIKVPLKGQAWQEPGDRKWIFLAGETTLRVERKDLTLLGETLPQRNIECND